MTLNTFKHILPNLIMETNKDKKEKLEKTGITVCTGWQRGCFNEATDGYKKCLECREAERLKEKKSKK